MLYRSIENSLIRVKRRLTVQSSDILFGWTNEIQFNYLKKQYCEPINDQCSLSYRNQLIDLQYKSID